MADRYWVGGAGTWNTTLTTNWRTTSGGSTVAAVPTAADNVIFDSNSGGTFTVTMTGVLFCANITVSAGVVTFATGTTPTLSVYGSMSLISATVWNLTGTVSFLSTSAQTISTNGVIMDSPITFNGVSGSWTLGSNFAFGKTAIRAMTMTNGTLDSANYTITSSFASTITNSANSNSLLNMNTTLATTMTAGTLAASGTFGAFTFTAGTLNLSAAMTTGTFTHTAGTLTLNNFTFTCSTFLANGATVRTFAFGTSGSINVTYSGATATIWNQTTVGTLTVTGTPTVNIRSTATNTVTYTVTPGAPTEAQSLNFNFLSGSYNLAFLNVASNACRDINFTGLSGVWTGTGSNSGFGTGFAGTWTAFVACTIYGGITLSSLMTVTASAVAMTFVTTVAGSNKYFCLNGKTFLTTSFVFNGTWSGTPSLTTTFYFLGYYDGTSTYVRTACMATTGVGTITVNSGTFDGYNVASPLFPGTSNVVSGATGTVDFKNWATLTNFSFSTGNFLFNTTVSSVSETGVSGFNRNRIGNLTLVSGNLNFNGAFQCGTVTHTAGIVSVNDKAVTGAYTFTSGNVQLNTNSILQVDSMAASGATTRLFSFGSGTSYIICLGAWDQTTIGTLTVSTAGTLKRVYINGNTKTIATGAPTAAQALDFYFYDGTGTLTFSSLVARTLDFSGKTVSFPFVGDTTYSGFTGTVAAMPASTMYGPVILKTGMTLTESVNIMTFATGGLTKTLTTDGKSIPFPITINDNITLQDSLAMGATVARALIVTAGIFDVNQKAITAGVAGSTMSVNGTVTIRNFWKNSTIPFTLTAGALTLTSTMTNPEAIGHWWTGGILTGAATITAFAGAFTFTAGTLTLGTDFWMDAATLFTWTAGTITLSNFELQVGRMSASGAGIRAVAYGTSGQITTLGTGTVWDQTTIGTFTYTGTSKINISNYLNITNSTQVAQTVIPGVAIITNAQNFNFYGAAGLQGPLTFLATATHAVNDVFFSSNWQSTWAATAACTIFGNITLPINGTLTSSAAVMTFGATASKTFTSSGKTIPFPITFSGVAGTWVLQDALTVGPTLTTTLNNGTLNLNDYVLTTGLFSSTSATARTIAYGPTALSGRIVCNYAGASATVFTTATVTNLTVTGTYPLVQIISTVNSLASVYTIATGALTETNNFNFWFQGVFSLIFLGTAGYTAKDIDFAYYGNFAGTWTATAACTIYGSVLLNSGMTLTTSASAMTLGATSGTKTFKSNGKSIPFPITLSSAGSTLQLTDAFTMSTAALAFTHTAGTLDLNAVTCTVGVYSTGVGTKSLIFNTGYLYVSGSGVTAFNNANPLNYTVGPGGGYGFIFMSSATAKTFVGGGTNYDCYVVNSGAGALTISGNNTFTYLGLGYTILVTGSNSFKQIAAYYGSRVLTLTAGTTQTITVSGGWNVVGSSGDITTINSATAGSLATITRNYTLNDANYGGHTDYVSLKDIQFLPSNTLGNGALPNIWWAGSHSTNLGNNFGVTFTDWSGYATTSIKTYYISNTSTTSWTTPADWNPANNIVHMIGAGGGGAGSRFTTNTNRAGGAGGGGGGYTKITNYSAAAGTSIGVSVGSAGTAGAAGANGSFGASTLFTNETTSTTYRASFNGTNQYLVVPQSSTLAMSADFCIEGWTYSTSFASTVLVLDQYPSGGGTGAWQIQITAAGLLQFVYNSAVFFNCTTLSTNKWYHFAITRSGSTMRWFLNGTLISTTTYTGAIGLSNYDLWIGQQQSGGVYYFNGYMSNIRIVKGSPVYTANFCPTVTPLTSITNTILLTCHASSISDGSGTFTITNSNSIITSGFSLPYFAPGSGGGSTGTTTSTGGTGGVGSTYTGGTGGDGAYSATAAAGAGGGGGGGAAGPLGNGGAGGASFATATTASVSGGGGGGNGGGTAGTVGVSAVSGKGGNNNAGIGGGATNGAAGTFGGGGASNVSAGAGAVGGFGIDILNTWGGGGGTGGPAQLAATNALTTAYGAGGAGGGVTVATTVAAQLAGGNGGPGLIVIQYYPVILDAGTPGVGSGFFAFF